MTLIDREWVLTASHCIQDNDENKYVVIIGGINRRKIENSEQVQFQIYTNDIALLQMSHNARVTPLVNTVCLPKQKVAEGTKCFISG